MKKLIIPFIVSPNLPTKESIDSILIQQGTSEKINCVNWIEFPHAPEVWVYAGYCREKLWFAFQVSGDYFKSEFKNDQDPVWQESCVEFFLKVEGGYINFEFNALGTSLAAFGEGRNNRQRLSSETMESIVRFPSLKWEKRPAQGQIADWSLTVGIPLSLLRLEQGDSFKANFYKCGDMTAIPHYLSWNPIQTENPDFHRPEFFGDVLLQKPVI